MRSCPHLFRKKAAEWTQKYATMATTTIASRQSKHGEEDEP